MEEEAILADAAQFAEAELGVAPEAFDPVAVVFAAGKLVFTVMDAMVFLALGDEAVAGPPAVGADVGSFAHASGGDRHQFLLGAAFDDVQLRALAALVQAADRDFSARAAPSLASHPTRPEIALVHLHLPARPERGSHAPPRRPSGAAATPKADAPRSHSTRQVCLPSAPQDRAQNTSAPPEASAPKCARRDAFHHAVQVVILLMSDSL